MWENLTLRADIILLPLLGLAYSTVGLIAICYLLTKTLGNRAFPFWKSGLGLAASWLIAVSLMALIPVFGISAIALLFTLFKLLA